MDSLSRNGKCVEQLIEEAVRVRDTADVQKLERKLRLQLKQWYEDRIIVIDNVEASGDEIVQRIIDENAARLPKPRDGTSEH